MSNYKIHDGTSERDMTVDEAENAEAVIEELQAQVAAVEAAAAAKVSARAKLKALGLTDAEIAALVG